MQNRQRFVFCGKIAYPHQSSSKVILQIFSLTVSFCQQNVYISHAMFRANGFNNVLRFAKPNIVSLSSWNIYFYTFPSSIDGHHLLVIISSIKWHLLYSLPCIVLWWKKERDELSTEASRKRTLEDRYDRRNVVENQYNFILVAFIFGEIASSFSILIIFHHTKYWQL